MRQEENMSLRTGLSLFVPVMAFLLVSCEPQGPQAKERGKKPPQLAINVPIATFETEAEIRNWTVRPSDPPTVFELSREHVTEGKLSAKAVYPKYKKGSEQWPAVILYKKNLPVTDWRPFQTLTFDVYTDAEGSLPLFFHLRDEAGARAQSGDLAIKKGRRTITVPIEKLGSADLARVNEIHFFMTEPAQAYTFYLDNVVLHSANLADKWTDLQAACGPLLGEVQRCAEAAPNPEVSAKAGELEQKLSSLAKALAAPPASLDAPTFTRHYLDLARAEELKKELQTDLPFLKVAAAFRGKDFGYGWTSSVEKVFRTEVPFKGEIGGTPLVELARNEHEGVQLALMPLREMKGVAVEVSDLTDAQGRVLSKKNVQVCPVGFVKTNKPPYKVDFVGWHPDPLLSFLKECDLEALAWQPFWIDVCAPKDQAPGLYTGMVTITAKGAAPTTVPMQARVWSLALGEGSRLPLALAYGQGGIGPVYIKDPAQQKLYDEYCQGQVLREALGKEAEKGLQMRQKCFDLILSHRLIPDNIYRGTPPLIEDVKYWRQRGARWFNIIHVGSVASLKEGDPYPADRKKKILDALAAYVPELQKEGLLDMAYIYGFDEVRKNQFAAIKDIFGEIKKRYPKIPLMTTGYDESLGLDTGLDGVVDVWVPLTAKYDKLGPQIKQARARGRQVWWYICCGPRHPYANWFIEYPATDHRLVMGFMAHKFGTQGFLYYALALWRQYEKAPKGKEGWKTSPYKDFIKAGPLTTWTGQSWSDYNGDGQIMYPGPDGPLSTIRMENIRDGIEDYEYLCLLKDAASAAKSAATGLRDTWTREAEAALEVNSALVDTLTTFSSDGNLLLSERRKIAGLLEEYYRSK
jgi:hypothetical protein